MQGLFATGIPTRTGNNGHVVLRTCDTASETCTKNVTIFGTAGCVYLTNQSNEGREPPQRRGGLTPLFFRTSWFA